jgi:hypothetical protein
VTAFILKAPQAYMDAKRQGSAKETSIRKRIHMLNAASENNDNDKALSRKIHMSDLNLHPRIGKKHNHC